MSQRSKTTPPGMGDDKGFSQAVRDSTQQIWLAGLGAFSRAQDEGRKMFETLVQQGINVERRTRSNAEEKIGEVAGTVSRVAGDLGRQASESWDKLEQVFERRVERALTRMGVPTSEELEGLAARLATLEKAAKPVKTAPSAKLAKRVKTTKAAKAAPAAKTAKPAPTGRPAKPGMPR